MPVDVKKNQGGLEENRVVITGAGVVSSLGLGRENFFNKLKHGETGIRPINGAVLPGSKSKLASRVEAIDIRKYFPGLKPPLPLRFSQLALVASSLAVEDANLDLKNIQPFRIGLTLNTSFGPGEAVDEYLSTLFTEGPSATSPILFTQAVANAPLGRVAVQLGLRGPSVLLIGSSSIAHAYNIIKEGKADVMLCGGIDELRSLLIWTYDQLGLTLGSGNASSDSTFPCPYDLNRCGMVLGEGACIIVLEDGKYAERRQARILGEMLGYGVVCDRNTNRVITEKHAEDVAQAMRLALADANVSARDIGYVCGFGNSSPTIDQSEALAIREVLGAKSVPVSSIKGSTGEAFSASAAFGFLVAAMAVQEQVIVPTVGTRHIEPSWDIDVVCQSPRNAAMSAAICNSFDIGGNNTSYVIGRNGG